MTSIELTEEHKNKLLEMIENLFLNEIKEKYINDPAINTFQFEISEYNNEIDFFVCRSYEGSYYFDSILTIHWFEFCVDHLLSKVGRRYCDYERWRRENGETNIIDYCYKVFKKKSI